MLRVAAFVSGGGTNLQAIIDAQNSGIITDAKVELVISNVAGAYALERAEKAGIKTATIRKKDYENAAQWEDALVKELKKNSIDLIVLAGFLSILSENFIKQFPNKIINVHPSLIPSFCGEGMYGLKVHEAALAKGVRVTGATVHYVNEVVDGGEIIAQKAVEVLRGDTPETLQKRVMEKAEWVILPRAIQTIAEDVALGNIIANTRCISEGELKNKAREVAGVKIITHAETIEHLDIQKGFDYYENSRLSCKQRISWQRHYGWQNSHRYRYGLLYHGPQRKQPEQNF